MSGPWGTVERRVTPAGRDTIDFTLLPIVFVPGVMGSRLRMPEFVDWDPDSGLTLFWMSKRSFERIRTGLSVSQDTSVSVFREFRAAPNLLDKIAKDPDPRGELVESSKLTAIAQAHGQGDPVAFYESRGWGGVAWGFYGKILKHLETTFNWDESRSRPDPAHPVYAFGYDFRQSNHASGAKLVAFIGSVLAEHPGARDVILVTHSMGGLVARAAMAVDPSVMTRIRGVVHGVQPALGAVVAYRRFHTGATKALDGADTRSTVLEGIMGTDPHSYTMVQSGLPGPMELLPNHLYQSFYGADPWLRTSPPADLSNVYELYRGERPPGLKLPSPADWRDMLVNALLDTRLGEAETFHRAVAGVGHPNTHVLFGKDVDTDVSFDWSKSGDARVDQVSGDRGDHTVPAVSASCPNLKSKSISAFAGIEHAKVYNDDNFNRAVVEKINLIQSSRA